MQTICSRNSNSEQITQKLPIIRDKSGKLFKCPDCGKEYKVLGSLYSHRNVFHGQRKYVCDWKDCRYSTATNRRLAEHKKRHLNIKPFHCLWPGCDSAFVTQCSLNAHSIRHTDSTFCCPHCNRMCKTPRSLKQHIMGAHSIDRPFECDQCSRKYATKDQLMIHLRRYHSGHKFQCDQCDYKDIKRHLDIHYRRVHLREKTCVCGVNGCDRKFFDKNALLAHQMSAHSDERKFACDWPECGSAFKLKSGLVKHVSSCHTGEKKQRKRKKTN